MLRKRFGAAACIAAGALMMTLIATSLLYGIEFGIPKPMPEPFNIGGVYGYEYLPADGLTIYFASNFQDPQNTGGAFDIYLSERASLNAPWQSFQALPATINTPEFAEFAPSMTADGQQFFFMRAGSPFGIPNGDLFVSAKLPDGSWGDAQPLQFNTTEYIEALPTISPDGLTLYFNTLVNDAYPHPPEMFWNMYVASRDSTKEPFGTPEYFYGGYGTVAPDGLKHVFMAYPDVADYYDLPRVNDDADLYIRTRSSLDAPWGEAQFLKPPLSASGLDCCPFFSAADSTLYFVGTRPGTDASGALGFVDMWQAPLAESVPVDVRPGSNSNIVDLINTKSLPIAALSTSDFDARDIDPGTLLLGDPLLIADGATPVSPLGWTYEDVNGDTLMDLVLAISVQDLAGNAVIAEASQELYMAGQFYDGTAIAGRDMISVIPEPSGLLLLVVGLLLWARSRQR